MGLVGWRCSPAKGHLRNVSWMLTDFTEQNGATAGVPGTHRATANPNGDPNLRKGRLTEMQVTAPRRSVMLLDGRLWHNAGSNYSNDWRIFCGVSYGPCWLSTHVRLLTRRCASDGRSPHG